MKKTNLTVVVTVVSISITLTTSLFAAKHPGEKVARGFMNSWNSQYEVTDNLHKELYYNGPAGIIPGLFKGACSMAVRCLSGFYDILTFPAPIPKDYDSIAQPELNF